MRSGCLDHSAIWSRTKIWRRKRSSPVCASESRSGRIVDIGGARRGWARLTAVFRAAVRRRRSLRFCLAVGLLRLEQVQAFAQLLLVRLGRHVQGLLLPFDRIVELANLRIGGGQRVEDAV